MEHANKAGGTKLLHSCSLPLTGAKCMDLVITDRVVFTVDKAGGTGLKLIRLAPEVTLDEVRVKTEATFKDSLQPSWRSVSDHLFARRRPEVASAPSRGAV